MQQTESMIYLGDIVTERATIDATIKSRELKAVGIISQITSILKNVTLGIFYFQTALILRDSMLLNGILTNSECWNFISQKNFKILEDSDARLFSFLFGGSFSTNRVLYYLETARSPIRYTISKRRLMYLWHILSRDTDELIAKVYQVQRLKPVKYDWHNMIVEEKEKYGIKLSDEEIRCLSKNKFKQIVNNAVNKFALTKLLVTAQNQSKCKTILRNINENDFKIQSKVSHL